MLSKLFLEHTCFKLTDFDANEGACSCLERSVYMAGIKHKDGVLPISRWKKINIVLFHDNTLALNRLP